MRLHTLEVQGYNPSWAEPVIRRNYSHRHISDRPYLRLALHALKDDPMDIRGAIYWMNEADSPLSFALVVLILELSPVESRRAICAMHQSTLTSFGRLDLLRMRNARPADPLTARQRAQFTRIARDEQALIISDEPVSRARAFARGLEWSLHVAWSSLVANRKRKERAAAKQAAAAPPTPNPTPFNAINFVAHPLLKQ